MRHNIITITDRKGRSCQVEIWTPSTATKAKVWNGDGRFKEGDWQTLDKGFLSVNRGDATRSTKSFPNVFKDADLWLGKPGAPPLAAL